MTTEEIIRVLAERDGWEFRIGAIRAGVPDYLNSKDAIGRVLEKLTDDEMEDLEYALHDPYFKSGKRFFSEFTLTLPAGELARCVAEAIKK